MEFLLTIFLVGLVIYLLMPTIRAWILRWIVQRIQRNVMNGMGQNMGQASGNRQQARSSAPKDKATTRREKMNMDEIEAKRFDKENSDDYVDFEELPK